MAMDDGLTFDFETEAHAAGGAAAAASSSSGRTGGTYGQGRFHSAEVGGQGFGGAAASGGYSSHAYGSAADANAGLQSGPTRAKKNTVCRFYLQRKCTKGAMCEYLHFIDKDKMPECKYGVDCDNPACMYKHTGRDQVCVKYTEGFCPFGPYCKYGHKPQPASELPPVALMFTAGSGVPELREQTAMQGQGPRGGMGYTEPAPGDVPADGLVPKGSGTVDAQGRLLALVSEYVLTAADKELPAAAATGPLAFFTVRAAGHTSLKASVRDGLWIVPDALAATLEQGLSQFTGGIFLFFSAVGSRAFQGCAKVTAMYKPTQATASSAENVAAAAPGTSSAPGTASAAATATSAATASAPGTASAPAASSSSSSAEASDATVEMAASANGAVEMAAAPADVKPDISGGDASGLKVPPAGYQFVRIEWLRMCALPFKAVAMVRVPTEDMASVARCSDWGQLPVPVGLAMLVLCWRRPKLRVNATAARGEVQPASAEALASEDLGREVAEADELTRRELESGGAGEGGMRLLSKLAGTGCHQQREPPVIGVSGGLAPANVPAQAVARILQHSGGRPWAALAAAWASGPGRLPASGELPNAAEAAAPSTAVRAVAATELHDGIDETEFPPDEAPEAGFGFVLGVTGSNVERAIKTGTVFMEDAVLAEGMASVRAGTPVLLWHRDLGTLHGLFVALDRAKELRISGGMGKPAFVRAIAPFAIACRLADLPITAQEGLWEMAGVAPRHQPPGLPQPSVDASAVCGTPRSGLVSRRFLAEAAFRMQMATRAPAPVAARMAAVIRHLRGLPIAPRDGDPLAPGFPLPEQAAIAAAHPESSSSSAATAPASANPPQPIRVTVNVPLGPAKRGRDADGNDAATHPQDQPQSVAAVAASGATSGATSGAASETVEDDAEGKRAKPAEA